MDDAEIAKVREGSRQALLDGRYDTWAEWLDEDYLSTTSWGAVRTKADSLNGLNAGDRRFLSLQYDDVDVRTYGDVAVEIGRVRYRARSREREVETSARYTIVYVRAPTGWRLLAHQASPITQETVRVPSAPLPIAPDEDVDHAALAREIAVTDAQVNEAMRTNEAAVLDRLIGDDCVFTNERGMVFGKAHRQALVTSGRLRFDALVPDEVRVRVYGAAGIVTERNTLRGSDEHHTGEFRYTRVYVERAGNWQLVAAHKTRIAAPPRW